MRRIMWVAAGAAAIYSGKFLIQGVAQVYDMSQRARSSARIGGQ